MRHGFGNEKDFKVDVRIVFWNINGFKEIVKSDEVSNWLHKNFSICFLSETHMTKGEEFNVDNFKCVNHPFSDVLVRKPRGGLTCMIKLEIMQYITDIDCDTPDHIVVKFHGGHKVFASYIPPSDSLYYSDICFTSIPNTFSNENGSCVIGGGDLNSRVGDVTQTLPLLGSSYRTNVDKEVNAHGKLLRKICSSTKCYILNNLSIGDIDFDGGFTFFKGERKSQNDVCLSNEAGLRNIKEFQIHRIGWNFSDHYPVSVTANLDCYDTSVATVASSDLLADPSAKVKGRPRKIVSENVDWQSYRTIANEEINLLQGKLESLASQPTTENLNDVIDVLSTGLCNAARTCEMKHTNVETDAVPDKTDAMRTADDTLVRYSSGLCSWKEYDDANKAAVTEISAKHYAQMISSWENTLKSKDSKEIWNKIDWKGYCGNIDVFDVSPEVDDLASQFKSKDSVDDEVLLDIDFGSQRVPVLDDEMSREELENACTKLKEGKSTADGWVPKMLTEVSDTLLPVLLILFNIILLQCIFPGKWLLSVVIALFKNKGSRLIAKYFRPVSLVVMLSKLFDFTLLARFKKWFTPHDLQTAYQDGKSCGDHIFLLRCLRERFILDKRKLFITAIDFDGAFDRVKRSTLLRKLLLFGASSLFVHCLANLYSISGNIIYSNGASATYMLCAGIKQGLPLSPYLFLFYIDDVFDFLDRAFVTDSDVFNNLHILIHADDANLIATTKEVMISKLKSMLCYCKLNSIVLQATKCFFTVLNSSADDKTPLQVTDNDRIEYRDHLEILGSHISETLKRDLSLHFDKRFKNVIKFFNYVKTNRIAPTSVKLKVLRSAVVQGLLHNCEAFGPKVPEGLEQVYYRMIRAALGVRSNVAGLTLLVESGCLPLECLIHLRQLKFYRRFLKSVRENSVREMIFHKLLDKITKYLDHYMKLNATYATADDLKKHYVKELHQKIRGFAENKDKHYKYWSYVRLNPELAPSPFLNRIDQVGKSITKFRLGSHKLKIEIGRWHRIPRNERLCTTCQELGDENHVIYNCTDVYRDDLTDLPTDIAAVWTYPKISTLFKRIIDADYLD